MIGLSQERMGYEPRMSDETAQDPSSQQAGSQEPAEGGEVPDAGPGAERADDRTDDASIGGDGRA